MEWAKAQIEMAPHRRQLQKWIIEFRDHPIRAGWVELSKFHGVFDPDENRLSDDVSLGYQLAPSYWSKGVATEAAHPILAYAFEVLGLDRIVAFTHIGNLRSARVLEKLGFQQHAGRHYKDDAGNKCRLYCLGASHWRPILNNQPGSRECIGRG